MTYKKESPHVLRTLHLYLITMKKIAFAVATIFAVFILNSIGRILFFDFNRLTEYGMGYLFGQIFLLLLSLCVCTLILRKIRTAHLRS